MRTVFLIHLQNMHNLAFKICHHEMDHDLQNAYEQR